MSDSAFATRKSNGPLWGHTLSCLVLTPLLFSITLLFLFGSCHASGNISELSLPVLKIKKYIQNGSVLVKDRNTILFSHNENLKFIPASITKIVTSLAAIEILGPKYRFKTEFYQTESGDLFIKGYGDPFLISEEIDVISKKLNPKLLKPISSVYIDLSAFELSDIVVEPGFSLNPYDARNFALSVNFNTINYNESKDGQITSAEHQTPDLEIIRSLKTKLGVGSHRINISQDRNIVIRYAGELFLAKLIGDVRYSLPNIDSSKTPEDATLLLVHNSSKTLLEVIESMLLYSNNFIANQIFLTLGASQKGYPATWDKAEAVMSQFLNSEVGLTEDKSYKFVEGSGISRKNMITADGMLKVLDKFKTYSHLLPTKNTTRLKSGTLNGVYSYAGFLDRNGNKIPFIIMLNQHKNNRDAILKFLKESIEQ